MVVLAVASPVLERLRDGSGHAVLAEACRGATYLDLDGFVIVLTGPGVPRMPNGIALGGEVAGWPVGATPVPAGPGHIRAGPGAARWSLDAPPAREPVAPEPVGTDGPPCGLTRTARPGRGGRR